MAHRMWLVARLPRNAVRTSPGTTVPVTSSPPRESQTGMDSPSCGASTAGLRRTDMPEHQTILIVMVGFWMLGSIALLIKEKNPDQWWDKQIIFTIIIGVGVVASFFITKLK